MLTLIFVSGVYFLSQRDPSFKISDQEQIQSTADTFVTPSDWKTYSDQNLDFSISFPPEFETVPNGENSLLVVKKVDEKGAGPANFIYISVVPKGSQTQEGQIYNYNKDHIDSLMTMQVSEKKILGGEDIGLSKYITFKRHPDNLISGNYAKVFTNSNPWEFPAGTKEYRYIVAQENVTYLIGGYLTTTDDHSYSISEELFDQILSTVKLPPASDQKMVDQVVENFYQRYLSCIKNSPEQTGELVIKGCQNNTGLISDKFAKDFVSEGISDPITCSQNLPDSITVLNSDPGQNFAQVVEVFGAEQKNITIKVLKENGFWVVDQINCP